MLSGFVTMLLILQVDAKVNTALVEVSAKEKHGGGVGAGGGGGVAEYKLAGGAMRGSLAFRVGVPLPCGEYACSTCTAGTRYSCTMYCFTPSSPRVLAGSASTAA